LSVAVPRNLLRNVGFQINVFDTANNRRSQQSLTLFLSAPPSASIFCSSTRDDDRRGAIINQSTQVRQVRQPIEPQLNKGGTFVSQRLMFKYDHLMASATNTYANHIFRSVIY
jgi:hypothetical protein